MQRAERTGFQRWTDEFRIRMRNKKPAVGKTYETPAFYIPFRPFGKSIATKFDMDVPQSKSPPPCRRGAPKTRRTSSNVRLHIVTPDELARRCV
jgi:hypothetical protein